MQAKEMGNGIDSMSAQGLAGVTEKANWNVKWNIQKFANDEAVLQNTPFETEEFDFNLLANAGIDLMLSLLCGGSGTNMNNSNAHLGVGDSATAAAATQTDLVASSNKLRKAMNASYPTYGSSQQAVWQADFGSSEANFAWNEFAVFNASSAGIMLNRKVSAQGTKVSGQTWRLTLTVTVS